MPRTGRRPGQTGTKDAILVAARRRFAEDGFRGATIRAIAGDAAVDPALIHHYFGTKRELFAAVLEFPASPDLVVEVLSDTPDEQLGDRIIRTFLDVWDQPDHRERMQVILRSATIDDDAARMFREFIIDVLLAPVAERIGADDAELRVTLIASQLAGFAFLRYLLEIEPLASAAHGTVVAAYGPTIQRYLTGDIPT